MFIFNAKINLIIANFLKDSNQQETLKTLKDKKKKSNFLEQDASLDRRVLNR